MKSKNYSNTLKFLSSMTLIYNITLVLGKKILKCEIIIPVTLFIVMISLEI